MQQKRGHPVVLVLVQHQDAQGVCNQAEDVDTTHHEAVDVSMPLENCKFLSNIHMIFPFITNLLLFLFDGDVFLSLVSYELRQSSMTNKHKHRIYTQEKRVPKRVSIVSWKSFMKNNKYKPKKYRVTQQINFDSKLPLINYLNN